MATVTNNDTKRKMRTYVIKFFFSIVICQTRK